MVVGRIGVGSICDLCVQFVICGCGFVGDVVLVPWWWLCRIFFFIGDFVWFGLRKKIGDLSFFFPCCGLVAGGGGYGCD